MEKEFYTENFEEFLKEATEDFKMYPSRRVWHSLYNDLHPAKRWPSLAVSLLLVTAILYVGIVNNNAINAVTNKSLLATQTENLPPSHAGDNNAFATGEYVHQSNAGSAGTELTDPIQKYIADQQRINDLLRLDVSFAKSATSFPINQDIREPNARSEDVLVNKEPALTAVTNELNRHKALASAPSHHLFTTASSVADENDNTKGGTGVEPITTSASAENDVSLNIQNASATGKNNVGTVASINDRAWIDDHAFYNRRNQHAWKSRSTVLFYVTPSIGYRSLAVDHPTPVANSLVANTTTEGKEIDQTYAINLEAGAAFTYKASRKLSIKGGLQLNYTNYNVNAYSLNHPAQTTLAINNSNSPGISLEPYNTLYANSPSLSNSKLKNKTVQLSIPIGLNYLIAGNTQLKWYAGATIQPGYVASADVYLLSFDRKFYVNENSFINRWNVNTAFETFVTYKINDGLSLQAGPQVRYQLFSTYSNRITATEKLYNAGLKFGLIRNL